MILGKGQAPGKVILFGEHAVVYGRPALAVPVTQLRAEATVEDGAHSDGLVLYAQDLGLEIHLESAPEDNPLALAARLALAQLGLPARPGSAARGGAARGPGRKPPSWLVTIRSSIPIASGLGSGAAVSAALVRALADAAGRQLSPADLSTIVFEVDKLYHGTPSGIDNSVICYERPVYFVRGQPPQIFSVGKPFLLAIADSGIASPTKAAVADVRQAWEREPTRLQGILDHIASIVEEARGAIEGGRPEALGPLMNENHDLLREIGVSSPELEALAAAARRAGAGGAKLSGGGRGGNLIALVTDATAKPVSTALKAAGAVNVMVTTVGEDASRP